MATHAGFNGGSKYISVLHCMLYPEGLEHGLSSFFANGGQLKHMFNPVFGEIS